MNELLQRHWDVVVIGTGVGGATLGRAMAEQGRSVLFVEKGRSGFRLERQTITPELEDPAARAVRGYWPDKVDATVNGQRSEFFAPLGCGVGGSSVFYAGTLERPEPHDLDHSEDRPHPVGGWPMRWQEMLPWLEKAEAMYGVHDGSTLPASPDDTAIMDRLRANGHQPSLLQSSIAGEPGCLECRGNKCPRTCKKDARSAGVEPALATGRAALLEQCEALALRGDGRRVTHLDARLRGEAVQLRADRFVLAAGALSSPRLLLASASEHWPGGCGNAHDQVGRHLMFHAIEVFAVWPRTIRGTDTPSKSVGLRDLYLHQGQRLGMVQAMGVNVGYGEILHFLRERVKVGPLARLAPLTPLAAYAASIMMGRAKLFVGQLEDLPYPGNRVLLDPAQPGRIRIEYTMHDELLQRRRVFRKTIQRAFKGMRPSFVNWQPELNFGHGCGTLRAGDDPRTSALDAHCKVHGVENLHVVDASFFPTSMGVNPSLTIAANALRVADHLVRAAT